MMIDVDTKGWVAMRGDTKTRSGQVRPITIEKLSRGKYVVRTYQVTHKEISRGVNWETALKIFNLLFKRGD